MQIGKEMAIPSILKIGNGALGKIGGYLKAENLDQVVLFFGNGLIDMFGELVMNSLKEAEVNVLEYNELDTVDIDDIITLAFAIPNKAKAVISIGGGKVIDAGKYAAFLRNLPFISVPTSSSSDGFSSASASLLVQGKRTSVPARLAYGIIVDTQVIRTAPEKFIYSGIGDMISKITALYDWIFEEKAGCGEVNDFAVMIAKFMGLPINDDASVASFADAEEIPTWGIPYIAAVTEAGYMRGKGAGNDENGNPLVRFASEDTMSRAEVLQVLGALLAEKAELSMTTSFADDADIPDWARTNITRIVGYGLISGFEDNTLRPGAVISRAEIAALLVRIHGILSLPVAEDKPTEEPTDDPVIEDPTETPTTDPVEDPTEPPTTEPVEAPTESTQENETAESEQSPENQT